MAQGNQILGNPANPRGITESASERHLNGCQFTNGTTDPPTDETAAHQTEPVRQNQAQVFAKQDFERKCDWYSNLYLHAPAADFALTKEALIIETNLTGAAMLGVARTLLSGQPFSRFVAESDERHFDQHRRQVLERRDSQTCEITLVKNDGSQLLAQLESTVIPHQEDGSELWRTVITDLTGGRRLGGRRRESSASVIKRGEAPSIDVAENSCRLQDAVAGGERAEEALLEKEALLHPIVGATPGAIITIDNNGTIEFFCHAAERMFGFSASEVLGQKFTMLVPDSHREAYYRALGLDCRSVARPSTPMMARSGRHRTKAVEPPSISPWRRAEEPATDMAHDPTIFIVDGDQAVSDSLQALLESFGFRVEIYNSGEAFLEAYAPPGIGCLLMDLRLPDLDGQKFLEKLNTNLIDLPVIIITARSDVRLAVKAMQAGAVDFVEKPFEEKVILGSIDRALTLSAQARHEGSEVDAASALISRLTSRERDVLEELVFGRSNKAIALELGISPRTVEIHRAHVMEKMEARSLSHLVRLALVAGINP